MNRWIIVVLTVILAACTANAGLIITEVMSSSAHPSGTANGDWFELYNNGPTAIDLTNYSWDDDSNIPDTAGFGGKTIAAYSTLIVNQETVGSEAAWRTDWGIGAGVNVINLGGSGLPGFNNTGDTIYIYDATDALVTSVTFGAATLGYTFEWSTTGVSLGLSVIGENGAFRAAEDGATGTGIDVGSPGVVPEPGTLSLSVAGMLLLALRRRLFNRPA